MKNVTDLASKIIILVLLILPTCSAELIYNHSYNQTGIIKSGDYAGMQYRTFRIEKYNETIPETNITNISIIRNKIYQNITGRKYSIDTNLPKYYVPNFTHDFALNRSQIPAYDTDNSTNHSAVTTQSIKIGKYVKSANVLLFIAVIVLSIDLRNAKAKIKKESLKICPQSESSVGK